MVCSRPFSCDKRDFLANLHLESLFTWPYILRTTNPFYFTWMYKKIWKNFNFLVFLRPIAFRQVQKVKWIISLKMTRIFGLEIYSRHRCMWLNAQGVRFLQGSKIRIFWEKSNFSSIALIFQRNRSIQSTIIMFTNAKVQEIHLISHIHRFESFSSISPFNTSFFEILKNGNTYSSLQNTKPQNAT